MDIQTAVNQPTATLIDVREKFEFMMGHAKGALNIPLGKIPSKIEELRNMSTPLILYCRSGNRSGQAAQFLKSKGFTEVYNAGSLGEVRLYKNQFV